MSWTITLLADETERKPTFEAALKNHQATYLTHYPTQSSIFTSYDAISWDNDLGPGGDVVLTLSKMFWRNQGLFNILFCDKIHLIHSANPVAAERLHSMFEAIGAKSVLIPIGSYNNVQVNRNLAV